MADEFAYLADAKPCPYCGSSDLHSCPYDVICRQCQASQYLDGWNRRAMPECVRVLTSTLARAIARAEMLGECTGAPRKQLDAVLQYYEDPKP